MGNNVCSMNKRKHNVTNSMDVYRVHTLNKLDSVKVYNCHGVKERPRMRANEGLIGRVQVSESFTNR